MLSMMRGDWIDGINEDSDGEIEKHDGKETNIDGIKGKYDGKIEKGDGIGYKRKQPPILGDRHHNGGLLFNDLY
ncbi:hypothetical protein [Falsibacillus albus]|uniref:Uncharacterized protein n=1 Tax=Falsibacillus albus TaxID=2478915 RepID=A0A3L7JS24_9BACI|nr:hypothetical protein [Falsibacillus albus]RLQ93124.1 hypothetical protein D9X91_19030 [Falsibacillus albus]